MVYLGLSLWFTEVVFAKECAIIKSCAGDTQEFKSCGKSIAVNKQELTQVGDTLAMPIKIYADLSDNKTGVILSSQRTYQFIISNVEQWHDCDRLNVNPMSGWLPKDQDDLNSAKRFLLNSARAFTYMPKAGYMELLGEVGGQHFRIGNFTAPLASSTTAQNNFKPKTDGELIVRANEPKYFNDFFYSNNSGTLLLQIITKE